ncbi:NAD-dependent epimerase/dehydratase family protein [Maribacter algicola]|uniref:NAD-dependent epimerase/dehydratase family protein n=1 Tax=Meishania litoralis TaxID=3434685 RepID=A0ACC7LJH7_9FLAO
MVLVTGGTGLVGSHLLLRLLQKGVSVRAIHRDNSDLNRVRKIFSYYADNAFDLFEKIHWVSADLSDITALEAAFENIDQVYHTAALISFDPKKYPVLQKINTEGTANIVNLCLSEKIKKLCYVSTIGAIGKSTDNQPASEENDWVERNVNVYALTKYDAEMEVWRGAQEGLPVVIVNPGVILGPGFWNHGSGEFFTTANKGYPYYPPGGTGFVSINDVVELMIRLTDSKIQNERYIVVANNISFKTILTLICKNLGKRPPHKELKHWQLQIGRYFDYLANLLTSRERRITKNSIKSLYQRDDYTNEKIKKSLDFEFEPLEPVIEFCCAKFKEENR